MAKRTATKAREKPAPTDAKKDDETRRKEILLARDRILGGLPADPDLRLERVAELVEEHDAAARKGDVEKCEKLRRKLSDQSARDFNWRIPESPPGSGLYHWDVIPVAVLMDLR